MKPAFVLLLSLFCHSLMAQQEDDAIKRTITHFFDGMKSNDTALISSTLVPSCFLYSIHQNKAGKTVLENEKITDFLQQVANLKGQQADERLHGYEIKIDDAMAIAWTPYTFYFNGQLSHCGVNVFTLIKDENGWKIMGITDTRRKKGCD